jgi:hypothetical protein
MHHPLLPDGGLLPSNDAVAYEVYRRPKPTVKGIEMAFLSKRPPL